MKKSKKLAKLVLSTIAVFSSLSLASCAKSATLNGVYTSPSQLTYSNMRPTYNYYLLSFSMQSLETYDDNTYCLNVMSEEYSAVILPEEGNEATGNERTNYIYKYYGTFTQVADDLDEDTAYATLSTPTRVVAGYDSTYYADSDNWSDAMKEATKIEEKEYDPETGASTVVSTSYYETGAEYLASVAFKEIKVTLTLSTSAMAYATLTNE